MMLIWKHRSEHVYIASVQSDGTAPCAAAFLQARGELFWVHLRGRLLVPARLVPPLAFVSQTLRLQRGDLLLSSG